MSACSVGCVTGTDRRAMNVMCTAMTEGGRVALMGSAPGVREYRCGARVQETARAGPLDVRRAIVVVATQNATQREGAATFGIRRGDISRAGLVTSSFGSGPGRHKTKTDVVRDPHSPPVQQLRRDGRT